MCYHKRQRETFRTKPNDGSQCRQSSVLSVLFNLSALEIIFKGSQADSVIQFTDLLNGIKVIGGERH